MQIIAAQQLESWKADGKVLEQDSRGVKVILLADGKILKIFRPRRKFWLARILTQAERFASNAEKLKNLKIATPTINECFWINKKAAVSACLYTPLPGKSLEDLFKINPEEFSKKIEKICKFIKELHNKGIYFRSLHLGNILILPNEKFGLIDFLDISFSGRPLSKSKIKRNIEHFKSHLKRREIENFPLAKLMSTLEATPD